MAYNARTDSVRAREEDLLMRELPGPPPALPPPPRARPWAGEPQGLEVQDEGVWDAAPYIGLPDAVALPPALEASCTMAAGAGMHMLPLLLPADAVGAPN